MRTITAAELAVLVRELGEFVGSYIDRFYEVSDGKFRLRLSKNRGRADLQVILSHTINRTSYIEKQEMASNFTLAVRKRIEGCVIKEIRQLNNDRIVLFALEKKEENFNLIIEMFGKGNLIITDKSMKIVLSYTQQEFKDRAIKPGVEYKAPRQAENYKVDIPERITPMIYRENGKAIDYAIASVEKYKKLETQHFKSLQEALDAFYFENFVGKEKEENVAQKRLIEELQNSIKKQEKILKGIDGEIAQNREAGKALLDKMHMINEMVRVAQGNKRITREELQRMFPKIKILNVDLKDKKIRIEL